MFFIDIIFILVAHGNDLINFMSSTIRSIIFHKVSGIKSPIMNAMRQNPPEMFFPMSIKIPFLFNNFGYTITKTISIILSISVYPLTITIF